MAGGASEEELLLQIQCLVADSLCVVSYKWLSRNFSLSSNVAKRLLQKFVKQNEDLDIEVVYAVSGWTKEVPNSYAIQLVPKAKLEEAKCVLKGNPSIHVYSVQPCLPADPAQLCSADFVQSEKLFNEAADIDNCLRDNRFSGVTCPLAKRLSVRKKSVVVSPPLAQPPVATEAAKVPAPTIIAQKSRVPSPPPNSVGDGKDAAGEKKPTPSSASTKTLQTESGPSVSGKKKVPVVTSGNGGGGSLASMWGKAPSKPKAPSPPKQSPVAASPPLAHVTSVDADARILAMEAAEVSSDDDMASEFASMRRGQQNNSGGRRRRMIVDEDEDSSAEVDLETVIRPGSPDSPDEVKPAATISSRDTLAREEGPIGVHEKLAPPLLEVDVKPSLLESNLNAKPEAKGKRVAEEKNGPVVPVLEVAKGGSKRKKTVKTRIDERGREVTEVIWEMEGVNKENVDKEMAPAVYPAAPDSKAADVKPSTERAQSIQKPSIAPSKSSSGKASSKNSTKSSGKPGKGQGNIMSFFKKT